jgi:hypothetical protein
MHVFHVFLRCCAHAGGGAATWCLPAAAPGSARGSRTWRRPRQPPQQQPQRTTPRRCCGCRSRPCARCWVLSAPRLRRAPSPAACRPSWTPCWQTLRSRCVLHASAVVCCTQVLLFAASKCCRLCCVGGRGVGCAGGVGRPWPHVNAQRRLGRGGARHPLALWRGTPQRCVTPWRSHTHTHVHTHTHTHTHIHRRPRRTRSSSSSWTRQQQQ